MTKILDGKLVANKLKEKVTNEISNMVQKPYLAVILVGNNPASRIYVNGKKKDCSECGIFSGEITIPETISQNALVETIIELNEEPNIDGILLQLPLPKHLNEQELLSLISVDKDVDCFHPTNVGKLIQGSSVFYPCTPSGVIKLLEYENIDLTGKHCVVVGRSNIVGKPLSLMLLERNATVTICHSKTENLKEECLRADVLISAVGIPNLITSDMVKDDVVIVDIAMNRNSEGKLCGDVDFKNVSQKASYITPVPGGVGPMTRAVLMENTLKAAKLHNKK